MLKRKLSDGTVVGLSIASEQGGLLITLDKTPPYGEAPKSAMSFMLNPVEAMEFWGGLGTAYCRISDASSRTLEFRSPPQYVGDPMHLKISEGDDSIRFPLRQCELDFIRKALPARYGSSLLFVGEWSGEPEEL